MESRINKITDFLTEHRHQLTPDQAINLDAILLKDEELNALPSDHDVEGDQAVYEAMLGRTPLPRKAFFDIKG